MARGGVRPSWASMNNWNSPDLSPNQETYLPSGDQAGFSSVESLEWVRLRMSPFSAGMVKISPRASTATRRPVGEMARDVMREVTSCQRGIIQGKSPVAVISTMWVLPDLG